MARGSPKLPSARLIAASVAAVLASSPAPAQSPRVGAVIGNIDGLSQDGDQMFIFGWACQQGQTKSVALHILADHSAYDTPKGTLVGTGMANLDSEPAVAQACQDPAGGKHRFVVELPDPALAKRKLYIHAIRIINGVENAAIHGSGAPLARLSKMQFPMLAAFAVPSGAYHSPTGHPRVFMTAAELRDIASRANRPGSYSMERFRRLADGVKRDLSSHVAWDATYSGCDIDVYLRTFAVEQRGGYASQVRSEDQLRAALNLPSGATAPAGAAVVASRLALYAALVKAGVALPPEAANADQAAALAKRILLAWGTHGFRDKNGHVLSKSEFCNRNEANLELQVSRGIVYSVHAQDLLMDLGVLEDSDVKELNGFHSAMYDLIRRAHNGGFGSPHPACEHYANGAASALTGLLAIARLLDDGRKFNAAVSGMDPSIPVLVPWTVFFDHVIYGQSDRPIECYANSGPDGLTSHDSYVTAHVAAGEIQDRYRNANPLQAIGYAMGSLEGLFQLAEIMQSAGLDPYGYRGTHRQSIEMATQYYACYARGAGYYKPVTADNSASCPNAAQYVGKLVNAVEVSVLIGAYRFPGNKAIIDVEAAGRIASSSPTSPQDYLIFGKWRD
jgi:hypothetical protein